MAKPSKRSALQEYLERNRPPLVGENEFDELRAALAISEDYLRRLLRASGYALHPLVEGVRQDSLEDLERTLLALGDEYAASDLRRARRCRRLVIQAKDHAKFALRRGAAAKEEMILWMLTWLENPGIFPHWLELRKRRRSSAPTAS